MQNIVLSGHLIGDCEVKTDKKGCNYIRFKVACEDPDLSGKSQITIYRCYSCRLDYKNLKDNDLVFIDGQLVLTQKNDTITLDVLVQSIDRADDLKPSCTNS